MVIQILLATGSILVGYIIVNYLSFVESLYIRDNENKIKEHAVKVLSTLIPIVETKSHTTKNEILEMSEIMKGVIKKLPNSKVKDWEIEFLSLLHFVSRIELPDYLFEKHEALTEYEMKIVQNHCMFGCTLLRDFKSFDNIKEAFMNHHLRKDGTGYPNSNYTNGNEIPKLAQILGLVDSYLAMIYPRAYHSPKTREDALLHIQKVEKSRADPEILAALVDVIRTRGRFS